MNQLLKSTCITLILCFSVTVVQVRKAEASLVEYAMLVAIIARIASAGVQALGTQVEDQFNEIRDRLGHGTASSSQSFVLAVAIENLDRLSGLEGEESMNVLGSLVEDELHRLECQIQEEECNNAAERAERLLEITQLHFANYGRCFTAFGTHPVCSDHLQSGVALISPYIITNRERTTLCFEYTANCS